MPQVLESDALYEQVFEGAIVLGWLAAVLIIAALAVTAVGLMIVMHSRGTLCRFGGR
jgi:hypothetical protein